MNNSRISTLLGLHHDFLLGMFCSDRHVTPLGHLVLSDLITDPYYNFFCPEGDFDSSSLGSISEKLYSRDRQPALYLTPLSSVGRGEIAEFSQHACDSWMLRETRLRESANDATGIEMESVIGEMREEFLSAFSSAYSSDDAVDLYGPLDESYIHALSRSFDVTSPKYEKFYLLARAGGRAVGVVVLMVTGTYAAVYALGTVADARRQGVGSALMNECSRIAFEAGAKFLFLQVEAGSGAEKWYQKLGYRHEFYGTCYASSAPQ
ncbi:GNAT family N-acetyltransferase [Streptomyces sp. PSRA5]|uniref:GNAT family N-acetyltransferase n=1 Tax=Streptomyces panacea TaxID=3035064 RepID=UPI00339D1B73